MFESEMYRGAGVVLSHMFSLVLSSWNFHCMYMHILYIYIYNTTNSYFQAKVYVHDRSYLQFICIRYARTIQARVRVKTTRLQQVRSNWYMCVCVCENWLEVLEPIFCNFWEPHFFLKLFLRWSTGCIFLPLVLNWCF